MIFSTSSKDLFMISREWSPEVPSLWFKPCWVLDFAPSLILTHCSCWLNWSQSSHLQTCWSKSSRITEHPSVFGWFCKSKDHAFFLIITVFAVIASSLSPSDWHCFPFSQPWCWTNEILSICLRFNESQTFRAGCSDTRLHSCSLPLLARNPNLSRAHTETTNTDTHKGGTVQARMLRTIIKDHLPGSGWT